MEMQMEGSYVFIVVVTGLVVVFLGLVLLILFVWLMGKIFGQMNKSKADKKKAAAPVSEKTEVSAAAPAVEDGISDEVVAVITAAVAAVMGTGCTVRSVKKAAAKTSRRTAWGAQGISESTRAF